MVAFWLLLVLLITPGLAAGQIPAPISPIVPASPAAGAPVVVDPRTPPPPTIPSAPEVVPPIPPPLIAAPGPERPVKTFDFRPTLGVSEEYTDNFFRSSTHPASNFRSSLTPGMLVLLDRGFLTGQAAYTPSVFYDTTVDDVGVNHYFTGQLTWRATPLLKLSATDSLTHSDDPARADRLNLQRGRPTYTSTLFSLTGDYTLLERLSTEEYYRLSYFSDSRARTTSHTVGASLTGQLSPINILTLGYEYLHSESTVDATATARDTSVAFLGPSGDSSLNGHQVTTTFSRDISRVTTAGVTAVYAVRDQTLSNGHTDFSRRSISLFNNYVLPDKLILRSNMGVAQLISSSASDRTLLTSDSDLSYFLGPAVLGLRIERGFSETFGQGQNFGVVETFGVTGSVAYRFTPLISATLRGSYRENKFTGEGGDLTNRRDDKTVAGTATLTYQIFRWLYATLDYSHTETKSSDPLAGYTENRVRAALTASFY